MGDLILLDDNMIRTPGGLLIPRSQTIDIVGPGTLVLHPSLDRDEELQRIVELLSDLLEMIQVCFIHCFDGRKFWRKLWRYVIMIFQAEIVMRMSLAGAASGYDTYISYITRVKSALIDVLDFMEVFFPVITHSPCGRFPKDMDPRLIALKGTILSRKLCDRGKKSVAFHFHCGGNGLELWVDDYFGYTKTHPLCRMIHERAQSAVGWMVDEGDLGDLPDLHILTTTMAMGYPPAVDDPTLVLCEVDANEIRKSLVTAQRLKGRPPVIEPIAFYANWS
ncbi:MAG: hypothetical protein WCT32_02985 [Patescibacteria group bacterium]